MAILLDKNGINDALNTIINSITAEFQLFENPVIIGIKRRGVFIAERIKKSMEEISGKEIPYGTLDISLYRDDQTEISDFPLLNGTDINFSLRGKNVILVDDILNSGRTALAALKGIMDIGRPENIKLTTLLFNSNGREFPIIPDYYGKLISLIPDEIAIIKLMEYDNIDEIDIIKRRLNSNE